MTRRSLFKLIPFLPLAFTQKAVAVSPLDYKMANLSRLELLRLLKYLEFNIEGVSALLSYIKPTANPKSVSLVISREMYLELCDRKTPFLTQNQRLKNKPKPKRCNQ